MWLLSCEEEETCAILPQVAVAPLAKKCSSRELPREIAVGKQSTEALREPVPAEHPSDQQLGKCCPQPPSSLHHGAVGAVFTLHRSETDGDFISSGMHMPYESSLSCFLCPLLSHSSLPSNTRSSPSLFGEEAVVCEAGSVPSQTCFSNISGAVKHLRQSSAHRFHRALVQPLRASARAAHIK